jgi:hypothetical protein
MAAMDSVAPSLKDQATAKETLFELATEIRLIQYDLSHGKVESPRLRELCVKALNDRKEGFDFIAGVCAKNQILDQLGFDENTPKLNVRQYFFNHNNADSEPDFPVDWDKEIYNGR